MSKRKTKAQLEREIDQALAKTKRATRARTHHTSRDESDDDWDVVMDALLDGQPKEAATIYHNLHHEHGGGMVAPESFSTKYLMDADPSVVVAFHDAVRDLEAKDPLPKKPFYRTFELRMLDVSMKDVASTYYRTARPMPLDGVRDRLVAAGVIDPSRANRRVPHGWTLGISRSNFKDKFAQPLP
jgi:hypothetical protein